MPGKKGKSGGQRPGAGRPAYLKVFRGQYLVVERSSISEAKFYPPEVGRVVGISNDELELQINGEILVVRIPDADEIEVKLNA